MKGTIIALCIAVVVIVVAFIFSASGGVAVPSVPVSDAAPVNTVASDTNAAPKSGTQVVEITAHGGYTPSTSVAKAGVPTIIRFKTQNSFDCSSSVAIPSLGYRATLPQTGTTDVPIPSQKATGTLTGTCGMGMYRFEVQFQ